MRDIRTERTQRVLGGVVVCARARRNASNGMETPGARRGSKPRRPDGQLRYRESGDMPQRMTILAAAMGCT